MRALVVEDDPRIAADLDRALTGSGFRVETVADGDSAWFRGGTENYDLIVLDLNLPDAIAGRWSEKDQHRSALDHLRATFDGRRRESLSKHLRHYLRPVGWVDQLWRD